MTPLNCAGQGCPERDGCKRYEHRQSSSFIADGEKKIPVFEWASYDVERALFDSCAARIAVRNKQ